MAGGNQQFCLRWNNHQSTLVSVFDTLFESGTLVDCTLAAEGRFLKAHKVVLSACSPYLEALLSQHYEKHPIIILKDVTFTELKAMLDYMYRGEVNISQDQLGTFLKAAESLHIKGLTDNSGGGGGVNEHPQQHKKAVEFPRKIYNPVVPARPKSPAFPQGLIVEPRPFKMATTGVVLNNNNNNIEPNSSTPPQDAGAGGASPKRTKRRRSCSDDKPLDCALDTSNEAPTPASLVQCSMEGGGGGSTPTRASDSSLGGAGPPPVKLEPKLEEYNNDDSGDDRQPYDDDEEDELEAKPGTSANSHPSGLWNTSADASAEEMFTPGGPQDQEALSERYPPKLLSRPLVASLKAVNTYMARLNTTVTVPSLYQYQQQQQQHGAQQPQQQPAGAAPRSSIQCPNCHKCYSSQHTLRRHMRLECGKEPQFHCPYCPRKTKQRYNLMLHIARAHKPDHTLQYKN